jgi:hypothetical protein
VGRPFTSLALAFLVVIPLSCGDDEGPPMLEDTGTVDTGSVDAGVDATPDSAIVDSGSGDTGPMDTGPMDTGPVSMPCTAIGPCDPFDPTSCPDGQSCQPGIGMTECVDIDADPLGLGETCTSNAQCAPGLRCLNFGDGLVCERLCPDGSIGFCGDDSACIGAIGGDMCIRVCRPIPEPCDIYAQDCSDPTDTCTLSRHPETSEPYTGCRPEGPQGLGNPCGGDDGFCQRGLICISEMGIAACRQVCGPDGAPPTCDIGECTGFARTWMVPYCR